MKPQGFSSLGEAHRRGKLLNILWIPLAIDAVAEFRAETKDIEVSATYAFKAHSYIERLMLAARAKGMFVLIASQYPTADVFGSQL